MRPGVRPGSGGISKIEDMLADVDSTTIGRGVVQAFKDGQVTEIIAQAFSAAFEKAINIITGTLGSGQYWKGIGQVMIGQFEIAAGTIGKLFLSLGDFLTAAFDTAFQNLYELIGKTPKLGEALGLKGYTAQLFSENYASRQAAASDANGLLGGLVGSGHRQCRFRCAIAILCGA